MAPPAHHRAPIRLWAVLAALLAGVVGCGGEDDPPTPDDPAPTGSAVRVDGLRYEAVTARQLNPRLQPDEAIVPERDLPAGTRWFGVFLRVCNESGETQRPTNALRVTGASGQRADRVRLAADNPYKLALAPLAPGRCAPEEGSTADTVTEGAALVYTMTDRVWNAIPLRLVIESRSGGETRATLLDR